MPVHLIFQTKHAAAPFLHVTSESGASIPAVGELVKFGDNTYKVEAREYTYSERALPGTVESTVDMQVVLACALVKGPEFERQQSAGS